MKPPVDADSVLSAEAIEAAIPDIERYKAYAAMAETTRKWATVMDAKAVFISTLNAIVLSLMWAGFKFGDTSGPPLWLAAVATLLFCASLVLAVLVVTPRATLSAALKQPMIYTGEIRPVSFYGYVTKNYPAGKFGQYRDKVLGMDLRALSIESLEQHYTISHIAQQKSEYVRHASLTWIAGLAFTLVGTAIKFAS